MTYPGAIAYSWSVWTHGPRGECYERSRHITLQEAMVVLDLRRATALARRIDGLHWTVRRIR